MKIHEKIYLKLKYLSINPPSTKIFSSLDRQFCIPISVDFNNHTKETISSQNSVVGFFFDGQIHNNMLTFTDSILGAWVRYRDCGLM